MKRLALLAVPTLGAALVMSGGSTRVAPDPQGLPDRGLALAVPVVGLEQPVHAVRASRSRKPAGRPSTRVATPARRHVHHTLVRRHQRHFSVVPSGSVAWAAGAGARAVKQCESGGDPGAVSASGTYRGAWQMDSDFWRTYGGLEYASRPELASMGQQDAVAYRGWLHRGWQPWQCADSQHVGLI